MLNATSDVVFPPVPEQQTYLTPVAMELILDSLTLDLTHDQLFLVVMPVTLHRTLEFLPSWFTSLTPRGRHSQITRHLPCSTRHLKYKRISPMVLRLRYLLLPVQLSNALVSRKQYHVACMSGVCSTSTRKGTGWCSNG